AAPAGARRARRLAGLLAGVNVLFLAVLGIFAAMLSKNPFGGVPGFFRAGLVLPLLAIALTLAVAWSGVQAWRDGWWTRYGRVQYSAIVLGGIAYLWLLNYVNLIGFNIG